MGKAYAFFDYVGEDTELLRSMHLQRVRANFLDSLGFTVIDDEESTMYDHKREGLPLIIAELAKVTDVYGAVSIDRLKDLPKTPKKAADLRYSVMAKEGKESNSEVAGMLNQVLGQIGDEEYSRGRSKFLRAAVFYQDSRRRAQKL